MMRRLVIAVLFTTCLPFGVAAQEPVIEPQSVFDPKNDFINILNASNSTESDWRNKAGRFNLSRELAVERILLKSNLEWPDHRELREIPSHPRDWKAEESLNFPIADRESLFVFGKLDSSGDTFNNQQLKMRGKTGVGWKYSLFEGSEVQFRTGPLVKLEEAWQTRSMDRSQWSIEMQAKLALFGPLQLQYAGEALPAFTPAERRTLQQDLKLALPFGANREMHIGAKYRWEDVLAPTPWLDRTQLYLGLKFDR